MEVESSIERILPKRDASSTGDVQRLKFNKVIRETVLAQREREPFAVRTLPVSRLIEVINSPESEAFRMNTSGRVFKMAI